MCCSCGSSDCADTLRGAWGSGLYTAAAHAVVGGGGVRFQMPWLPLARLPSQPVVAQGVVCPACTQATALAQCLTPYFTPSAMCRASYPRGIGAPAVAAFLQDANHETEVWLQVSPGAAQVRPHVHCKHQRSLFCVQPAASQSCSAATFLAAAPATALQQLGGRSSGCRRCPTSKVGAPSRVRCVAAGGDQGLL